MGIQALCRHPLAIITGVLLIFSVVSGYSISITNKEEYFGKLIRQERHFQENSDEDVV